MVTKCWLEWTVTWKLVTEKSGRILCRKVLVHFRRVDSWDRAFQGISFLIQQDLNLVNKNIVKIGFLGQFVVPVLNMSRHWSAYGSVDESQTASFESHVIIWTLCTIEDHLSRVCTIANPNMYVILCNAVKLFYTKSINLYIHTYTDIHVSLVSVYVSLVMSTMFYSVDHVTHQLITTVNQEIPKSTT